MRGQLRCEACPRWLSDKPSRLINLSLKGRNRLEMSEGGARIVTAVLTHTAITHGLHERGICFREEGIYAIQNSPDCTKPQGMHTDYTAALVHHLKGGPCYPRSAIWAAHAQFMLMTRDHGAIVVPEGKVIFFLADFWHSGGPAMSSMPRYHGFQKPDWIPVPDGVYT